MAVVEVDGQSQLTRVPVSQVLIISEQKCTVFAFLFVAESQVSLRESGALITMRLPLLILHIFAGSIGLLSGTVAMAVRKGGNLHRASGNVFTVAMLTLASSAFCLAILKSQQGNIVGSIGAFYLIGTAWLAGRRGERTSLIDWSALFIGLAGAVAAIALGVYTLHNPSGVDKTTAPAGMSFFFGAILPLATAGDIRMLARGGI